MYQNYQAYSELQAKTCTLSIITNGIKSRKKRESFSTETITRKKCYKKIKLKNRESEWERENMTKQYKKTSKLLSSCSRRLSSARIRCFPLLSLAIPTPTATTTEASRSSSSTNDGVSDSISHFERQMELQTNTHILTPSPCLWINPLTAFNQLTTPLTTYTDLLVSLSLRPFFLRNIIEFPYKIDFFTSVCVSVFCLLAQTKNEKKRKETQKIAWLFGLLLWVGKPSFPW